MYSGKHKCSTVSPRLGGFVTDQGPRTFVFFMHSLTEGNNPRIFFLSDYTYVLMNPKYASRHLHASVMTRELFPKGEACATLSNQPTYIHMQVCVVRAPGRVHCWITPLSLLLLLLRPAFAAAAAAAAAAAERGATDEGRAAGLCCVTRFRLGKGILDFPPCGIGIAPQARQIIA